MVHRLSFRHQTCFHLMFWSEQFRPRHYRKIFGDLQKGHLTTHNCILNCKGTDPEWAHIGSTIARPQLVPRDSPYNPSTLQSPHGSFYFNNNQVLSLHSCWEKMNYKTKGKKHSGVFQNLKRAWNSSSPLQNNYLFAFMEVLSSNLLALLTPLSPPVCTRVIWTKASTP